MGLIRKSLFLSTGGLIRPNSRKQRQASALIRAQKKANKIAQEALDEQRRAEEGDH